MDEVKVSICCQTYNHEAYIEQCLDGFMMQQVDFDFEVLVHDDASTDNTAKIIRRCERKYPGIIKTVYQQINQFSQGVSITQAYQFPRVQGKYIAFCEGDDYWIDPCKLQKQVDFLDNNPEFGVVYTEIDIYSEDEKQYLHSAFKNGIREHSKDFEDHLIRKGSIAPLTWVFRKTLLDKIELFPTTDDTFILMLEFFKYTKVHFLPDTTAVYRQRAGSVSRETNPIKKYWYDKGVFETQKYYIEKYNMSEDLADQIKSDNYFLLMKGAILAQDKNFIAEVNTFFKSKNICVQRVFGRVTREIELEKKLNMLYNHYLLKHLFRLYRKLKRKR